MQSDQPLRHSRKATPCNFCLQFPKDIPFKASAWKTHKPTCIGYRQQVEELARRDQEAPPRAPGEPSLVKKVDLLHEFLRTHDRSILQAAYAAVCHSLGHGDIKKFDYHSNCIHFRLSYRPDCGGNPSIAFRFDSGVLMPLNELDPVCKRNYDQSNESRAEVEANVRSVVGNIFMGLLPILYEWDGSFEWCSRGLVGDRPIAAILAAVPSFMIPPPRHEDWFMRLQFKAEHGHVLRLVGEEPSDDATELSVRIGRVKKERSKWVWVELPNEERAACGYPVFPGIVC
ncbi:hypothetical protein EW146_g4779 [Bondarzewia mesenterica]|uniref:Uncharacterized protein n=1 Tax=Bondarzewia mesenterica TaxID=1095465 RepID=A0A4S4LTI3_9AGAM|nr:hypothetical protein EW146_g4779 [Bondarzewia mesenterica]